MKREQVPASNYMLRRRGHVQSATVHDPQATYQKELDLKFTTKYIDTLNDLQRIQDENKRLMLRIRNLEVYYLSSFPSSIHIILLSSLL